MFRHDALKAHQIKWLGDIVLVRPVSFTFLTVFSLGLAATIIVFSIFGTYTKRITVTGQLIPDTGLMKIYTVRAD